MSSRKPDDYWISPHRPQWTFERPPFEPVVHPIEHGDILEIEYNDEGGEIGVVFSPFGRYRGIGTQGLYSCESVASFLHAPSGRTALAVSHFSAHSYLDHELKLGALLPRAIERIGATRAITFVVGPRPHSKDWRAAKPDGGRKTVTDVCDILEESCREIVGGLGPVHRKEFKPSQTNAHVFGGSVVLRNSPRPELFIDGELVPELTEAFGFETLAKPSLEKVK